MNDLAYLTATEALAAFREKRVSPVELIKAVIAKAEATEEVINAFSYRYFDEALRSARDAEARYMRGDKTAPLDGICIAVKDAGHIAGQPTSAGSLLSDESIQPKTSPVNQRVLAAGAIVHARTTTPEYSCASVTWSRRWGVTRNPWNPEMTPGGSSGGSGAALAAGSTTLATGSDIGGSIRIPASCCGVVGYKPPRGRNPVDIPFNLDPYCHTGPMARTVSDCRLLQNLLCGPHISDPTTLPRHVIADEAGVSGFRLAVSEDLGAFVVDEEIRIALASAAQLFRDLGVQVEEISLPWGPEVINAALTHLRMIFGTSILPDSMVDRDKMTKYARDFAEAGLQVDPRQFLRALAVGAQMAESFATATQGFDVLICPTTATPALAADFDPGADDAIVSGEAVDPMIGWVLTAPFNILSTRPALSLPMGIAGNGVPMGLQIVGKPFDDDTVFRLAAAFEQARGPMFDTDTNPAGAVVHVRGG